jgi:hypothetical protein
LAPAPHIAGHHIIMIEEVTLLKTNQNHAFLSGLEICGFQEGRHPFAVNYDSTILKIF